MPVIVAHTLTHSYKHTSLDTNAYTALIWTSFECYLHRLFKFQTIISELLPIYLDFENHVRVSILVWVTPPPCFSSCYSRLPWTLNIYAAISCILSVCPRARAWLQLYKHFPVGRSFEVEAILTIGLIKQTIRMRCSVCIWPLKQDIHSQHTHAYI